MVSLQTIMKASNNDIIDMFLNPKSVAVIGASKNLLKGGNWIVNNLVTNNFEGKVYPINPNAEGKLMGLDFKQSILDIEEDVDLAIFYIPNQGIPKLLDDCIKKGVKGAIIEASGFEEVGDKGLELRDQILQITNNFSKIRILGPNCMGISRIDGNSNSEEKGGFFSGFGTFQEFKRGNIAVISQSGMLNGGYLMHIMSKYPEMGFRYSVSVGNKMDLCEVEFLEYFLEDPTVNVIALYLESFKYPRKFIELCKKAKNIPDKTIIMVKGGLTSQGQKASLSHTGTLSEDSKLIEAVMKQAGIIQARDFDELFQFARTFSMMYAVGKTLPKKGNISLVAGSGGAGTIISDLVMQHGLNFPILGDEAYKSLENIFPEWMPPNRFAFVDIWPAMEKGMRTNMSREEVTKVAIDAVLSEPEVEGLFNMVFCRPGITYHKDYDQFTAGINQNPKPIFFWLVGQDKEVRRITRALNKNNIPNFANLKDMVKNFWILVQESKNKKKE